MVSGYYFDISAFVILSCLTYAFFIQRLNKVEDNTIVFASLFCGILSSGMSIIYYLHQLIKLFCNDAGNQHSRHIGLIRQFKRNPRTFCV